MLHTHRHGHFNASANPGGWHKDSYWGYKRMRNHHPWWAMIMYFPQNTPVELGPTGIMPGTQNFESRIFEKDETKEEALASGKAGTFALIHYDIWHRSTANQLGQPRYMLKFEFMRTKAPESPSWDNCERNWSTPETSLAPALKQDIMWEETWNWLSGRLNSIANTAEAKQQTISELTAQLQDSFEPAALRATYELARYGDDGRSALVNMLQSENAEQSRRAAYGLAIAGKEAVPQLIEALSSSHEQTVIHSIFALSEQRQLAAAAVPALNELFKQASAPVRRTIVEALGMIGEPVPETVSGLVRCLQDQDDQVRFMAGLALARLGKSAEAAIPELTLALEDENRYVRGHAAEALRYIGSEQANDVLIKFLFDSRWCPSTTAASTF